MQNPTTSLPTINTTINPTTPSTNRDCPKCIRISCTDCTSLLNGSATRKCIKPHRKSKWFTYNLPVLCAAVYKYRCGNTTTQIKHEFNISPRTLKRYVEWSKDPESPIYMKETEYEMKIALSVSKTMKKLNKHNQVNFSQNLTPFTPYAAQSADFGRQGCGFNPILVVAHNSGP